MCENCKNLFDIKNNLPYLVPCGHTLCQKCLDSLEFNNNKMKCPIDSNLYVITKEKIPKNEILIDYIKSYKMGPKYSYQIAELVIEEATFCHIVKRNCFQKICHYLYILIYVKILLSIVNTILWPFMKIKQLIRKIMNLIYLVYLKIKKFIHKIIKKIKSIHLPKINIHCKLCIKIKNRIINSRIIKEIIKFFKYSIRAPIFLNYLKLMKNLVYQSQSNVRNKCLKLINVIMTLMGICFAHLIAYFTNNLENFFIILLLLNESTIVLNEFRKMDLEKANKNYINERKSTRIRNGRRNNDFGMGNYIQNQNHIEDDDEYLKDKKKHHRGKKCITRWIGFILFWYFFPIIKNYIFNYIKYKEFSKDIDIDSQEKNIKIWMGVVNSLLFFPKLLIVIYLVS
jgi:hypothetical protein